MITEKRLYIWCGMWYHMNIVWYLLSALGKDGYESETSSFGKLQNTGSCGI